MEGLITLAILIFVGYRVFQSVQEQTKKNDRLNKRRPDAISRSPHGANKAFEQRQARREQARRELAKKNGEKKNTDKKPIFQSASQPSVQKNEPMVSKKVREP